MWQQSSNAEQATADSIRIADSIAAVEAAAAEAAAAAAAADTVAVDSAAVVAENFSTTLERIESLTCIQAHQTFFMSYPLLLFPSNC